MPHSIQKKLIDCFRPLYDPRVLVLLAICLIVGLFVDPAATLGLAGYLAYVIGMWGLALLITKMIVPYLDLKTFVQEALNGNRAAALVAVARILLLIAVGLSLIIWGK